MVNENKILEYLKKFVEWRRDSSINPEEIATQAAEIEEKLKDSKHKDPVNGDFGNSQSIEKANVKTYSKPGVPNYADSYVTDVDFGNNGSFETDTSSESSVRAA